MLVAYRRIGKQRIVMPKHKKNLRRTKVKATDEHAEEVLWECLNEVPFLQANRVKVEQRLLAEEGKPDVEARVSLGNGEKVIFGKVKENGQPRLVREAIADLSKCCQAQSGAYAVVIAPELTPDAQRICRQEGFGYLDYGGNCLLAFDHVFIHKSGRPKAEVKKQKFKSWYSPRAERVVRTLLLHPKRCWKIRELANESMVTPNQALHIKQYLFERKWLAEERDGFRLVEADLLLDNWSSNYLMDRSAEHRFQSEKSVLELEMALAGICKRQVIPYALMGFSAAMRYDPMFQHDKLSAYILSDLGQIVSELELTESKKGNVSLWVPYDEGVLRGTQDFLDIKVASPVQTYLDLVTIGGKAEKVAHSIWQSFIKDKWNEKIRADAPLISYSQASVPEPAAA